MYYGPSLGGKTTNLRALRGLAPDGTVGRLMNLETQDEHALFFNLLPMRLFTETGVVIKVKAVTVPSQPIHKSTRRIILKGADGIIFVASSQRDSIEENKGSFRDLRENLRQVGIAHDIPLVIQFNKQDLPFVRTAEEVALFGSKVPSPVIAAAALNGVGVLETLKVLLRLIWPRLEDQLSVSSTLGLDRESFEASLFTGWPEPREGVGSIT